MIVNANSIVQHVIQIKNEIKINANASLKKHHTSKKDYSWSPSTFICDKSKYLNSIVDNSLIMFDKIINVTDSASTNVTNTISINVTVTVLINSDNKKVRYEKDCFIYIISSIVMSLLLLLVAIPY